MLTDAPMPNIARLWGRIQKLAEFTVPGSPWTRRAFSPEFAEAREWLKAEFRLAGLDVTLDSGGNLIGRLPGADLKLKPLVTGSHCDTVVAGGRFDGIVGVLAGLEVAQTLRERGKRLNHSLDVIDFLSEEPSDYGISCVGSRALSGQLHAHMLNAANPDGETLAAAIGRVGGEPQMLKSPIRGAADTSAFVELHIEQGPVLERLAVPIGVVTHIVGIRRVAITIAGQADHAGTTPMTMRRDALVGASRVIERAHAMASERAGAAEYVVATIGRLTVWPNAPNAVPARVDMVLEVRSDTVAILTSLPEMIAAACAADLSALGVRLEMNTVTYSSPTICSPIVIEAVARAAASIGYPSHRMASGAGHDAIYVAPTGPIGMIFVPCRGGRSHCEEEWIEPDQLLDGARVLMQTLLDLDDSLP